VFVLVPVPVPGVGEPEAGEEIGVFVIPGAAVALVCREKAAPVAARVFVLDDGELCCRKA